MLSRLLRVFPYTTARQLLMGTSCWLMLFVTAVMAQPTKISVAPPLVDPTQLSVLLQPLPLSALMGMTPLVDTTVLGPLRASSRRIKVPVKKVVVYRPLSSNIAAASALEIESRILAMRMPDPAQLPPKSWYRAEAVAQFYEQRRYQLVWIEPDLRAQLLQAIASLRGDGLEPEDYFFSHLHALNNVSLTKPDDDIGVLVDRDMLMTEAYLRALFHLFNGKVDSEGLHPQWLFTLEQLAPADVLANVVAAVDTGRVTELFVQMRPQHPIYRSLQAGLARYRLLADQGGWPTLPAGSSLKPGITDPQIAMLRERLRITGEYVPPPPGTIVTVTPLSSSSSSAVSASASSAVSESSELSSAGEAEISSSSSSSAQPADPKEVYDDILVAAVKQFQRDQYLEDDGIVGAASRTALSVSAQARVDQIRVNLDRARWLLHNTPDDLLLVDIAGFKVTYIKARQPVWKSRVQVGMSYRTSPIFKSEINYITLNPTWTVPPTILTKDVLPKLRTDLSYLTKNNIRVLDANGKQLDPTTIDWHNPGRVMLRQDAGPKAALGRAVIRFPNSHSVYLHDTPYQALFNKSQRAFSSGCIRVERALELVELLLAETPGWDSAAIEKALATGKTRNVTLTKRIPIFLAYWTVDAISTDHIAFKPDIYARDPAVLAALNLRN